jgi:predicted RND superfamily exporter protein
LVDYLIKYRYAIVVLLLTLAAIAVHRLPAIQINTDFSQFLDQDDHEYVFFKKVQSQLKDDQNLLLLALKNQPTVLERNFLKRIDATIQKLKNIDHIASIQSITTLSYPVKSLFGISEIPYLSIKDSLSPKISDAKIKEDERITNYFINENRTVLLLWITLEQNMLVSENEKVLSNIELIRKEYHENETFLWGKSYIKSAMDEISAEETAKNILWSFIVLIGVLFLMFRRIRAISFAVFCVLLSVLIFYGGMIFFNRQFGLMSNLYPTIILIVGISDFIHFSIKYNEEISANTLPNIAYRKTIMEIGWAVFITSFTTAIGFFTLLLSPMKALNNFGLEAGISVILTFIVFMAITPIGFYGLKKNNLFELRPSFVNISTTILKTLTKTQGYPKRVVMGVLLILILSAIGIKFVNTNNLQYSIPTQTAFYKNYSFFEKMLGGSRTFELYLLAKGEGRLNTPKELNAIHKTYKYLDSMPYLNQVKSPTLYYLLMHRAYWPTVPLDSFNITNQEIDNYEKDLRKSGASGYLMNKSRTMMKISAQMKDMGRHLVNQKNHEILMKVRSLIDTTKVDVQLSGLDHLFDRTHESRIHNMVYGLLTAIILIALVLGLLYRSFPIVIIALILNIIPIIITAGIMGLTNLELRAGTSVIFTIAFVIAVDDTIHLLNKFKWERQHGKNIKEALSVAIHQCGIAIWATSLILAGAFFVLLFSNLNEIFSFGLLIGISIIIAFLTDIILTPILILHLFKK